MHFICMKYPKGEKYACAAPEVKKHTMSGAEMNEARQREGARNVRCQRHAGCLPQSRQIRRQRSAQCSVPKACSALDDRAGNEEPAHKNALQGQPAGRTVM